MSARLVVAVIGVAVLLGQSRAPVKGTWQLTMHLDSARLLEGKPTGQTAVGLVHFGPEFRTFVMNRARDTIGGVFGRHELDFTPFWGGPIPPDVSTSVLAEGRSDPITEAWARTVGSDSIVVMLNPRFSHGIVRLKGRYTTDSIVEGRWTVDSYASKADGHFRMAPKP